MHMQTGKPLFNISLKSGKTAAREGLGQVLSGLAPLELEPEELGTVELVLAEALNNIVEHAYPSEGPGGPIEIACAHHKDGLHFSLMDEGAEMPDGHLPLGGLPEQPPEIDDLPEGGFGWFLIQDLAKDVDYKRVANQNQLSLRIAVAYGVMSIS